MDMNTLYVAEAITASKIDPVHGPGRLLSGALGKSPLFLLRPVAASGLSLMVRELVFGNPLLSTSSPLSIPGHFGLCFKQNTQENHRLDSIQVCSPQGQLLVGQRLRASILIPLETVAPRQPLRGYGQRKERN
jgi:hypothetical protein